eukprot:m.471263 g.471263  ORF g.471263 m.471263 type:complete len:341 (+) comp57100_c0_seq61:221-1243(+)
MQMGNMISGDQLVLPGGLMVPLKYLSLVLLTFQNCGTVVLMRLSRVVGDGPQYIPGTAILLAELLKLAASCLLVYAESNSISSTLSAIHSVVIQDRKGMLQMSVPALCFYFQNFLIFIAITALDVTTYQVTFQLKLLITGLFSVLLLGKKLNSFQWLALVVLTIGVAVVQLDSIGSSGRPFAPRESSSALILSEQSSTKRRKISFLRKPAPREDQSYSSQFVGFISVILACISSGFAAVYFEKILKDSKTGIWLKNIQLAIYSIFFACVNLFYSNGMLTSDQFFQGYTKYVLVPQVLPGRIDSFFPFYSLYNFLLIPSSLATPTPRCASMPWVVCWSLLS